MRHPASSAEPDAVCPISEADLQTLYSAEAEDLPAALARYSDPVRVRLALFLYPRAHFRPLALKVAATVDPDRLVALAGTMGEVLAEQCRTAGLHFGIVDAVPARKPRETKPKISLGGGGRGLR
jgi:hypothetical protein